MKNPNTLRILKKKPTPIRSFNSGKKEGVDAIKEYFLNNKNLLTHESLVINYEALCATCCTPLYYFALWQGSRDISDIMEWLVKQGCRSENTSELRVIAEAFIKEYKGFTNKYIINLLKQNKEIITKKSYFDGTLLDIAKQANNEEAVKTLNDILKEE